MISPLIQNKCTQTKKGHILQTPNFLWRLNLSLIRESNSFIPSPYSSRILYVTYISGTSINVVLGKRCSKSGNSLISFTIKQVFEKIYLPSLHNWRKDYMTCCSKNLYYPISLVVCVHWVVIDKKETLESKVPKVFLLLVVLSAKTMEWKAHFLP